MSASSSDKVRLSAPRWQNSLASGMGTSDTTLTLNSSTGLPNGTGITLVIDAGTSTQEVLNGVAGAGNTITSLVRGQDGTSAQAHLLNATVNYYFTASMWNDFANAFIAQHSQLDGSHTTAAAASLASKFAAGSIAGTTLSTGTVPYAALLSTIFSSQLQNYTNTNSAGGTYSYINLGGIKLFWGTTPVLHPGANSTTNFIVNLPPGFFSGVSYASTNIALAASSVGGNSIIGDTYTTSNVQFYMTNSTGSPDVGGAVSILVIGG